MGLRHVGMSKVAAATKFIEYSVSVLSAVVNAGLMRKIPQVQ